MNFIDRGVPWLEKHYPPWLSTLRIILGIVLFAKGYLFITDRQQLYHMAATSAIPVYTYATIYPRALTLLVSGLLIACGLITRIACLCELPWALGAVIFANKQTGFFSDHVTGTLISVLLLILVIVFLAKGSGPWSVDASMRNNTEPDHWDLELDSRHLEHL